MIKKYLIERRSWIVLFGGLQLFMIFIAYLDAAVSMNSTLYVVFLSSIIFTIFVAYRYNKETKFLKSLEEWENNLDLTGITYAETPFEKIIKKSVIEQTDKLRQMAAENRTTLEKEKDELLSWVHEVKTPLTTMHLIIERIDDPKLKGELSYEWLRIHLLLDQQLHQKRIPFMENDLYIEMVDLKTTIFNEIKMLQSWCIHKGIGFDVELDVKEVFSDAKWLSFIIRQILTNAIKYSEGSDIEITSHQRDQHTILEIKDSGRGIDPKDLPRIFEKGFTSTTNHQDYAASGMGLYLTMKVARSLMIKIGAASTPGKGTTFTLTFPEHNAFDRLTSM